MLKASTAREYPRPSLLLPKADDAGIPKYAIKMRRSKLSQRFIARIKAVRLRVEGREIDFRYVRSIRRFPSETLVHLDTASLQVRHRHVRGAITFMVEGIDGELTLPWKCVEELRRIGTTAAVAVGLKPQALS